MKKTLKAKRLISLILVVMMTMMSTNVFAAWWWARPGYEWALTNRLTSVKTTAQLDRYVSLTDFYSVVLKYLKLKGVAPKSEEIHHEDAMEGVDNVAKGIFQIINDYTSKESLTIQQYYVVENYVKRAKDTLEDYIEYSDYLTKDSLKNINLYLDLSQYRAATLIEKRSDREYILSKIGGIKNGEIVNYNIIPYVNEITREEFLLVMYDLLSDNNDDGDAVIKAFYDSGVLVGFETGLELDKRITYSEMFTFLYRFEIFEF